MSSGKEVVQFVSFKDGGWITSTPDGYYDCSDNAMEYVAFFDGNKYIKPSHPIYIRRRKKNIGAKIGKIIDKYPDGVPQTKVPQIGNYDIHEIDIDEDEIPF